MGFAKFVAKTCGFGGYVIQYACITHCTFEYIGDFVMVSSRCFLSINNKVSEIETSLEWVSEWGRHNLVEFNPSKTQFCTCTAKKPPFVITPEFQGTALTMSESIGILGIDIARDVQFQSHLESKAKLASKKLGVLNRARLYFTAGQLLTLYKAQCSGPSMEPTLETNNILFTEHISPRLQRLHRGDIIIARSPTDPKRNICKRITGLPGDKVRGHFPKRSQVVPKGYVWLEGDNSGNSSDSRIYGPVPQGLIRSRVICRVWPLNKISSLTEY